MKNCKLYIVVTMLAFMLLLMGCRSDAKDVLKDKQLSHLNQYGITLTDEQLESMNIDAFLHDMDYFFGESDDSAPYALQINSADCERYEGEGYAYQRWLGGEYTMEEMLVGDAQVYMTEQYFPLEESTDPTAPPV